MHTHLEMLMEVDQKARKLVEDAQAFYDKIVEEIGSEKARIEREYQEHSQQRLETAQQYIASSLDEACAKLDEHYQQLALRLEKQYAENHAQWEDALFLRCIGR